MVANLSSLDKVEDRMTDPLLKPKEEGFSLPLASSETLCRSSAFARLALTENSLICLH